jgi:hypothetical protein
MKSQKRTSGPRRIPSIELADLRILLVCVAVILLTWIGVFGWRFAQSIAAHDATKALLPYVRDLVNHRGDWTQVLYRAELLGGAKMHDIRGTLPLLQIGGYLGFDATTLLNLMAFLCQACYGFIGVRAAVDLAALWGGEKEEEGRKLSWSALIGMAWLFAFMPLLGWKLGYGHMSMIIGSFSFLVLLGLILAVWVDRLSLTLAAISLVALLHCYAFISAQYLLYSVVFGGPILLGVLFSFRRGGERSAGRDVVHRLKRLAVPLLLMLGALGLSMPKFAGLLAHATGSDAPRSLGAESVIYSYTTATLSDWIASIPWAHELIPSGREKTLWHEINYPFGALLLFLLLMPLKRSRWLLLGLGVSLVLTILFSMNVAPVSTVLPTLVPPLKSFRVPERAMLPFAFTLPIVATAAVLYRYRSTQGARRISGGSNAALCAMSVMAVVLMLLVAPAIREVMTWTLALFLCFALLRGGKVSGLIPGGAALLVLGAASVSAFGERLLPFGTPEARIESASPAIARIIANEPRLTSPLSRVGGTTVRFREFGTNTPYILGLSNINGYWSAPRRFSELAQALKGKRYRPTYTNFVFQENSAGFRVLRQLYNVRGWLAFDEKKRIAMKRLPPTAGRAWFTGRIHSLGSFEELAQTLKTAGNRLAQVVHSQAWVIRDDPLVLAADLPADLSAEPCVDSEVLSVEATRGGQSVHVKIKNAGACPLVVAMNFTTNLHAHAVSPGKEESELTLFPIYGALTGVLVPTGVSEIRIEARPNLPLWSRFAWVGGLTSVLAVFALILRKEMPGKQRG